MECGFSSLPDSSEYGFPGTICMQIYDFINNYLAIKWLLLVYEITYNCLNIHIPSI